VGTRELPEGDWSRSGATLTPITMYLPKRDVHPTRYETDEFLESPSLAPAVEPNPGTSEVDEEDDEDEGVETSMV